MATQRILTDIDFDRLVIRTRRGARNLSFRVKEDGLYITVPPYCKTTAILEALETFRPKLLAQYQQLQQKPLNFDFVIDAPCFKLRLIPSCGNCFSVSEQEEKWVIACPRNVDFADVHTQQLLRAAIVRALKKRAAMYLPPLLDYWSRTYCLPYRQVRITGARSRWGSCTATKSIRLSCYLLLLPSHLIDYVLLHELAHTREMNHGPAFWELLDRLTHQQALQLRRELHRFRSTF